MSQPSTILPLIVASIDSGVTQADLNQALVERIERRTHELLNFMHREAENIVHTIAMCQLGALSDVNVASVLVMVESATEQLQRHRIALQYRMEALQQARATAAAPEAPDLQRVA